MFHISDYELRDTEIAIFTECANVERDGFIWFDNNAHIAKRSKHNACEILMHWATADNYGVQRIKIGVDGHLTRLGWHKRLTRKRTKTSVYTYMQELVHERQAQISKIFDEPVTFTILGWRPITIPFWNPRTAIKIKAATSANVQHIRTRAAKHLYSAVAKKPNA